MDVFDIVIEKPAEVSRSDGCVWYSHGKPAEVSRGEGVFDIVMEKPAEVSCGKGVFDIVMIILMFALY